VLTPQAVLSLMPVVIESASVSPEDWLVSPLRDRVPGSSGRKLLRDDPLARLRPAVWLTELDRAREADVPSVLV
jgi:hypothetical protein